MASYVMASTIIDPKLRVKANTFMASKTRIDDRNSFAMYVWEAKPQNGKYVGRPMLASEREAMMGYPAGYVTKPGKGIESRK